jgi:partner of Y14 and mago
VRKEIRIRPGYTPQEDVRRFRGKKQAQMDTNALPKGHIIGWTPPPAATKPGAGSGSAPLSKNAKKRQKQKEKKAEAIKDDWEDEDEGVKGEEEAASTKLKTASTSNSRAASEAGKESSGTHTPDRPNWAAAPTAEKTDDGTDGLTSKLEKLEVQ